MTKVGDLSWILKVPPHKSGPDGNKEVGKKRKPSVQVLILPPSPALATYLRSSVLGNTLHPSHDELKPLKPWTKMNPFFLNCPISCHITANRKVDAALTLSISREEATMRSTNVQEGYCKANYFQICRRDDTKTPGVTYTLPCGTVTVTVCCSAVPCHPQKEVSWFIYRWKHWCCWWQQFCEILKLWP